MAPLFLWRGPVPNNTVLFGVLVARVRSRADMENSVFVTDTEIRRWLNSALAELRLAG